MKKLTTLTLLLLLSSCKGVVIEKESYHRATEKIIKYKDGEVHKKTYSYTQIVTDSIIKQDEQD